MKQQPQPSRSARRTSPAFGLSLVEMMCTLCILMVLAGGALPSLSDLRARQALQGAAALMETDIQLARSLAISGGRSVRLSVQALDNGGSCYLIHTGAAHACRCEGGGQARCEGDAKLLRLTEQSADSGINLAPVRRSVLFDGLQGTVTPTATLRILDRDGRAIHQIVNIVGRVRSCSPSGLGGVRPCA